MKTPILLGGAMLIALAATAADPATLDRGQKEAGLACTPCHSLRLVQSQRLSRAAWNKELDKMSGWGTKITDREALLEYLVANFGDDKPPAPPEMSKNGVAPPQRKQ
jgi:mono/diheme cytochrome c family protein